MSYNSKISSYPGVELQKIYKSSTKPPPFFSFVCVFAFVNNAKSFAIAILFFFFLLFLRVAVFGRTDQSFSTNPSWFLTQKACDQDRTSFIEHTKKCFRKKLFPKLLCSTHVSHDIRLFMATSIHSIRESTRNSEKLENKLGRRWQEIHESNEREREIKLISIKVWGIEKGVMFFFLNSLMLCIWKLYKNCWWRTCFIRICNYILLVNDHDEVVIAAPSVNETVSTNHRAN